MLQERGRSEDGQEISAGQAGGVTYGGEKESRNEEMPDFSGRAVAWGVISRSFFNVPSLARFLAGRRLVFQLKHWES